MARKYFSDNTENSSEEVLMWFHPEPTVDRYTMTSGHWLNTDKREIKQYPYAKEAICSAVLNEDFKVSIANTFSKLGGDPLGEFINRTKSSLPIMESVGELLKNVAKGTKETNEKWKKEGRNTKTLTALGEFLDKASKYQGMGKALMNRAIVFQGARFSYFGGTGVSFDNVALNYTMFPYWDINDLDNNGLPKFKTVYDQLEIILPYVIGDFVPLVFAGVEADGKDSKAVTFLKSVEGTLKDTLSSFGSWQLPPGGFEAAVKDIDVVQRGTLKLKIGTLYSIENIIISSCNFSLSKHLIKHPQISVDLGNDEKNASQYLTPAFCDVQLAIKPVSMSSKNSLLRFIRGEGNVSDKKQVYRDQVNNLIDLEARRDEMFKEKIALSSREQGDLRGSELGNMLETNSAVDQYDKVYNA